MDEQSMKQKDKAAARYRERNKFADPTNPKKGQKCPHCKLIMYNKYHSPEDCFANPANPNNKLTVDSYVASLKKRQSSQQQQQPDISSQEIRCLDKVEKDYGDLKSQLEKLKDRRHLKRRHSDSYDSEPADPDLTTYNPID